MSIVPQQQTLRDSLQLIKDTVAKGATDLELELFIRQCERTGLDPFARQIYAIKRYDSQLRKEVLQTQVSIDGLRSLASETHELGGQEGPYWCGRDGAWRDVWLEPEPPLASRVVVLRATAVGDWARFTGVALYDSYCQRTKEGKPTRMWSQMAPEMLAKCAESLALRKAFPQTLSGLYTTEEMSQSSNITIRGESYRSDSYPSQIDGDPIRPPSPILEPPRPPAGDSGALATPTRPVMPDSAPPDLPPVPNDSLGPARSRVSLQMGRLDPEVRSAVLTKADLEGLRLPDEKGFTAEDANRWLELMREEASSDSAD